MQEAYRSEAATALSIVEPKHSDPLTKWNSTHEMCEDIVRNPIILESIMDSYSEEIGNLPLSTND